MFRVLMRCECNYTLVKQDAVSGAIRLCFGEISFYPDTGKAEAHCRRCAKRHVLDPGTSGAREATGEREAREALAFIGLRN